MTALHYAVYNKCGILVQTILRAAGPGKNALTDVYDNASRTPVTALFWNNELNDAATVRILTDLAEAIGDFAGINLSTPVPLPTVNDASLGSTVFQSLTLIDTQHILAMNLPSLIFIFIFFVILCWSVRTPLYIGPE